jgi:DMSO/TMAO reductase YedYZ molybdopterin-dependent catalytic subunit
MGITIISLHEIKDENSAYRRSFIYLAGAAALAVITGVPGLIYNLTRATNRQGKASESALLYPEVTSGPAASPPELVLENRIKPAPGTRPEITSNEDFYRVDINSQPPSIDGEKWRLKVGGRVRHPREFTLQELKTLPSISQYITLRCISNPIGGSLISTALYTGVPLLTVMKTVELLPDVLQIYIQSQDGFYESVVMSDLQDERTLLVYEMNQQSLPLEHGFPLRLYIPNRYGMKQPKWIISIDAIDHEGSGFWEDRDWSRTALVYTTSVVDNVTVDEPTASKFLPAGGIAWAGDRGIGRVEIRVDDGPWQQAQLRNPPLSPLTWVQWRTMISATPGKHTIQVRAFDLKGKPQTIEKKNTGRLDAETGLDHLDFTVA